ncbi:helix-turn-helix transcriptional regulator [Mucilaginibacter gynuensis]|uniref:Helix-turn-helix transcriptional regulator n=1 Tax=Mucilaginibacter gynuensis TaxID=1302236 RepID=A0ABP8GUQ9_9SPHI
MASPANILDTTATGLQAHLSDSDIALRHDAFTQQNFTILQHDGSATDEIPNRPDHYAMVLNLRGSVTRTVGHFRFKADTHSIHMVTPQSLNAYHDATDDLQLYIVLFKKDFLEDGLIRDGMLDNLLDVNPEHPPMCSLSGINLTNIHSLFKKLDHEYNSNQAYHGQMLRLLLIELLYEANRSGNCPEKKVSHPNRQQQLVNRFKKLIDEHFMTLRTVQEYADLLFVTAKHLSEVIKHETGLTPLHLIHNRVYKEATYWLCASELSVKQVADKLNFDTSSHFSRFFKHYSGHNPTDFQRIQCAIL